MTIPNLLNKALTVIPKQSFIWKQFLSNSINEFGVKVPVYGEPIECKGSIQRIELGLYQQLGLDFARDYRAIYGSYNLEGIEKKEQPDIVIFSGAIWSIVKDSPWYDYNGWNGVLVVREKTIENDNQK